jgi:hypothetical protein
MNDKPTEEQLKRIEQSAKLPIVPDEDCPVYTYKQLAGLYAEVSLGVPATPSFSLPHTFHRP